uniref:C2H2-type domain-containing protein n=1 Tax=Acrobeloides nanus TaxID=290746 RepID=A0A914CIF8_9BILA
MAQGLLAIGGCRQCSRTFTDRLELIHHFVDHFPAIFYSFEQRKISSGSHCDMLGNPASNFSDLHKKLIEELSNSSTSSSHATPARTSTTPPSLPVSIERHQGTSMATATATPMIVTAPLFSPLPTPFEHKFKHEKKKAHNLHPAMAKSIGKPFGRLPSDLPYHMCPYCCQTFLDTVSYDEHVNAHKMMFNSVSEAAGSSTNKCHYCDMQFSNVFLLTEHQKLHAQTCNLCNQIFMTVFDLNLHMGTHTGFSYDCKDCGRCFPSRKTLAEHNRTHRMVSSDSPAESRPESKEAVSSVTTTTSNLSPKKIKIEKPIMEEKPESLFLSNPYFAKLMHNSPRKRRQRFARDSASEENLEALNPKSSKRHRGTRPEPRVLGIDSSQQLNDSVEKHQEVDVDVEANDSPPNENRKQPEAEKDAMPMPGNLMAALLGQMQPNSQAEFMAVLFQSQNR